jgi:hypothetical protein
MANVDQALMHLLMSFEKAGTPADINDTEKLLQKINVTIFSHDDSWTVITTLMAYASKKYQNATNEHHKNRMKQLGTMILNHWQQHDLHEQIISILTYIWSADIITYLPYLVEITGPILLHYINLYLALNNNLDNNFIDLIAVLLETWHQAYKITKDEYQNILQVLKDLQHNSCNIHQQNIIDKVQQYCDYIKPSWIINKNIPNNILKESQNLLNEIILPHALQVIRFMNKDLTKQQELLVVANYSLMPLALKLKFLAPLYYDNIENLHDNNEDILVECIPNPYGITKDHIKADINLLQFYGPTNNIENCTQSINNYQGPCRMLSCYCQDNNTKGYYNVNGEMTWFCQTCIICESKIIQENYAVRQPLITGGWYGCYCSIECMCKDMDNNRKLIPLVVSLQHQLTEYGIAT